MIRLPGANKPIRLEDLPKAKLWPLPGLFYLVMGVVLLGLVGSGLATSERMLAWIGSRLQTGSIRDWAMPVQVLFAGWCALLFVASLLLTVTELFGGVAREEAVWDKRAWFAYAHHRKEIDGGPMAGESKLGYAQVDHPDMVAPAFFERLFMLMLTIFQIGGLLLMYRLCAADPLHGARVFMKIGIGTTVIVALALAKCGVSRTFAIGVLLWTPVVFRVAWGIEPASTGPAMGLPPFSLPIGAMVMLALAARASALATRDPTLLFVSATGLRRIAVGKAGVRLVDRVDQPLVLAATPTATGSRIKVARKNGQGIMASVLVTGDGVAGRIAEMLVMADGRADRQGSDEPSGIAGRLGELNLLAWVLLIVLPLLVELALLPPLIQHLRLQSLREAYLEAWRGGDPAPLSTGLAPVLAQSPGYGPAALLQAKLLWELGKKDEAGLLAEKVLAERQAWPTHPLVERARRLLTGIQANAECPPGERGPGAGY